jgi:hypothetical protein
MFHIRTKRVHNETAAIIKTYGCSTYWTFEKELEWLLTSPKLVEIRSVRLLDFKFQMDPQMLKIKGRILPVPQSTFSVRVLTKT